MVFSEYGTSSRPFNFKTPVSFIFEIIEFIESIGTNSGSVPLNPNKTAKSVACPFPVKERDPYKST